MDGIIAVQTRSVHMTRSVVLAVIATVLITTSSAPTAEPPRVVRENIEWLDVWVPGNGVEVRVTTLLWSKQAGVQNMVVSKTVTVTPPSLGVAVACVNMPDAASGHGDELVLQPLPSWAPKWADLRRLVSAPAFQELGVVAQQFAV